MKDKNIHKEEIAKHDDGNVHKIISDQHGCQQTFGISKQTTDFFIGRMISSSISLRSEGDNEKKAISDAEAKPEASRSTPAKTIATIAEKEGGYTVIPLKISANWHK